MVRRLALLLTTLLLALVPAAPALAQHHRGWDDGNGQVDDGSSSDGAYGDDHPADARRPAGAVAGSAAALHGFSSSPDPLLEIRTVGLNSATAG